MSNEQDMNEDAWAELPLALSKASAGLREARDKIEFRAVSKQCFNVLLMLARMAYDPDVHFEPDAVDEDKLLRMDPLRAEVNHKLKPVIRHLFPTSKQTSPRKFVLHAMKHAVKLQLKKTDTYSDAAQCLASTTAVVNMVTVAMGRRME